MRANRFALTLGLLPLLASALPGQALFVKPVKVLGDPHFIGTVSNPLNHDSAAPNVVEGREMSQPLGVALDTSVSPPIIYISDTANNRVLAYQYNTQLTPGAFADLILGQPDRFTTLAEGPGTALTTGFHLPTGLAVDSTGNLYVADSGNNRILRFAKPFAQPAGYQLPEQIIGQTSYANANPNVGGVKASTLFLAGGGFTIHTGLTFDAAGNLWVTDTGNNRVLRFPAATLKANANAPSADLAVGQADLVSAVGANVRTTKSGLAHPTGVSFDSAGRMLVADSLNRVVVYPAGVGTNGTASRIIGIVTTPNAPAISEIGLSSAATVTASGGPVIVVDNVSNRVLAFPPVDSWPPEATQFSPSATTVVGQNSFTESAADKGGEPSASSLNTPVEAAVGGSELFVTDSVNNRVLVFPLSPGGPSATASRVIGQLDFPDQAPNLAEGKEFNLAGTASGVAILDLNATPPHLYVADALNNRVLGFKDFQHAVNGQKADLVIGQPDFSRTTVNYPSNLPDTPNQQGLNNPSSLTLDSAGNLYVADTFNGRILRFPAPFASGTTTLESADLVIGQADFFSSVTDPTPRTMSAPISIAFTKDGADSTVANGGYLVAADANHNRVIFFAKPFSNGMSATKILGQSTYTQTASSADSTRFSSPRGVAVDPLDRILVADAGNARVQVFDRVQNLSDYAVASFTLSNGLAFPIGIAMAQSGQFWVADSTNNQLLHYPAVDQLPIKSYASDATQPAFSPRSGFVDPFNNLLVADGANRVLYFAPAAAVVNAANYIQTRPLAPGAFAAIFPSPAGSTNIIAAGTESAAALPLPPTLADTQVLVNNVATPLLFVSPGQINVPLSLSLPSSGTVDIQIVRASTGQVYAGAEVPLNSAAPGLFTIGATGTGQVAALNDDDHSINSATNAVVRGHYMSLFGTGQGPVANAPPDGQAPTGQVPTTARPQILLGGAYVPDANITYSGLAPSLVGVWQIDFIVPTTAPSGNNVPIKVIMNSIPSDTGQVTTTIALK